jgi:hypothetical protein
VARRVTANGRQAAAHSIASAEALALSQVDPGTVRQIGASQNGVLLYVVGGSIAGSMRSPALRDFPLLTPRPQESDATFTRRVARRIDRAIAAGATHLLVPRACADWLGDHPAMVDFFATHHDLVEARSDVGVLYALRPGRPGSFRAEIAGWQVVRGEGIALSAPHRLVAPMLTFVADEPLRGWRRGRLTLTAERLRTLRVRFVLSRPDRRREHHMDLYLSLDRPGFLIHQLPFVEARFSDNGEVDLDCDLKLDRGRSLERIELALVDEDNWRLHPMYPGGNSFALPAVAPAGARLVVRELTVEPASRIRKGPPFGTVSGPRLAPYRKPVGRRRDAVIFSSWVPEEGLALGDYFIQTLRRWHADSKIFVGINHGSSPRWRERLERSGLDVTIREAPVSQAMPCDPTGFVAALDAYRRHEEPFDLVWFGHTKGLGHIDEFWYATGRWMIERLFWSRRETIEGYFERPNIGLYSPHYLMMLQEQLAQTDALRRLYHAPCAPLGMMAVSTHFVMRDESLREFCHTVNPRFFRDGPEPFGGNRFFFEMAMPNLPIMQGFEPYIEPGLGGTGGPPPIDGVASILSDWRQNNAVTANELAKWRQDPVRFRTTHREHVRVD